MTPLRGEVWWVRLDPMRGSKIKKTRPCLVVGASVLNERRRTVIVVPLSSTPEAAPPLLVPVVCGERKAVAVTDQIRAVAKERFVGRLDKLSPEDLAAVEESLRMTLEL